MQSGCEMHAELVRNRCGLGADGWGIGAKWMRDGCGDVEYMRNRCGKDAEYCGINAK